MVPPLESVPIQGATRKEVCDHRGLGVSLATIQTLTMALKAKCCVGSRLKPGSVRSTTTGKVWVVVILVAFLQGTQGQCNSMQLCPTLDDLQQDACGLTGEVMAAVRRTAPLAQALACAAVHVQSCQGAARGLPLITVSALSIAVSATFTLAYVSC